MYVVDAESAVGGEWGKGRPTNRRRYRHRKPYDTYKDVCIRMCKPETKNTFGELRT